MFNEEGIMFKTYGKSILKVVFTLAVALLLTACGKQEAPKTAVPPPAPSAAAKAPQAAAPAPQAAAPAPAPAPSPQAAAPAPAAAPVPASPAPAQTALASQEFNEDPTLRCDILEVKRVSGGALLIKWRLAKAAAPGGSGLVTQEGKKTYHSYSWSAVYFTDAAENKKYFGLKDSAGAWIGQGHNQNYGAGEQQVMWMKFPAPPPTSTKITFVFSGFPPFEDLPVS